MKSLRLSARELAYLTGLLGADEFYGLEDPFFGLDRSEISAAVQKAQEDLDACGLLEMNFVGGASVSQAAADVVSVCARCDSYAVCLLRTRKGDEKRVLYRLGGRFVTLAPDGESLRLTESAEPDEVLGWLTCNLPSGGANQGAGAFTLSGVDIAAICGGAEDAPPVPRALKDALCGGLGAAETVCVIVKTDFAAQSVDAFICFGGGDPLCLRRMGNEGADGRWRASFPGWDGFISAVAEMLGHGGGAP